ncbi:MAG: ABC transporter permease [Chloroflexi bacterium]|nr:MAG: ABC transporter permease [Chloroflexota bacterium]TMB93784.1 MAG: ABC transporter permease [Chloroflexota bacterium]TMC30833.1 MAG: ABC transporter permease [Chloroflexota bacterium]TMC33252.1 MAG: ABC transporter permease [Chloroflexota bacterium]TMC56012.1 MAG: ABC transporter permease [Chloroflexota bacterium]
MIGVSVITFAISHVIPADPAVAALGDHATDEQIAAFRAEYKLDRPLPEQYLTYVNDLLHGDLGRSIRTRRSVADDLADSFPATFELSFTALLVSIVVGIPAGIWSAISRGRLPDVVVRVLALAGGSIPVFWLGLIVIGLGYYQLGWFPGGGRIDAFVAPPPLRTGLYVVDSLVAGDVEALRSSLIHLVLPALTLGYFSTAVITRMTRSSMLEVLGQDYMRTAEAKGLRERTVVLRHGLRNALIPTVTIIGLTFGSLLSGAVLTETIFSWPGLGRYATASAVSLDFPAVLGVTLLAAVVYPVANLVVDVAYYWLDPRIQRG